MAIRQLLRERDYEGALAKVAEELAKAGDQEFKLELLSVRLRVENATDDYTAAIATCETLISLDPNDAFHYLKRAENERSQEKRLGSVAKALELDPYYPSAFRLRAVMREEQLDGDPGCDSAQLISLVVALQVNLDKMPELRRETFTA
jgi:tetratricopeptide (TPR) repeat protein